MSSKEAYLACRFPDAEKPSYYRCLSSSEEMASMVWATFSGDRKFFTREDIRENDFPEIELSEFNSDNQAVEKEQYTELVQNAVAFIRNTSLEKVVVSRSKLIKIDQNFGVKKFFDTLCQSFPSAFVYLLSYENECWLGASPELLLQHKNDELYTVSLAGTRWSGESSPWTAKENEEQAWVTRYLLENLLSIGAGKIQIKGPYTRKAGHLEHLCTDISASQPKRGDIFGWANALHPTPAVCGYPPKTAMKFILENETYNRSYYAGYLGLANDGDSHFFVNLRCMKVFKNVALLFAGGGITIDSDPEKEWEETEEKMRVLRSLIS